MSTLATLVAELNMNNSGFLKGIDGAKGALGGMTKVFLAGGAAIAAGAAIAGVALFKIGDAYDSMSDNIAIKTGATGNALKALQDDAIDVFKTVPTTMAIAGDAIASVSAKTGDTGKNLKDLTASEIELARITGTDLNGNIAASAKVFNQFGVSAKDQTKTLDQLFNVSQRTGVGIDQLMQETAALGPTLKNMGLTAGQSANLIGKMDQAGLHTARDIKGMNQAIVTGAKAGMDAKASISTYAKAILNAGSTSEATALASKYFGKSAGPELAAALRDGTISVDDLTGSVDENGKSILDTAKGTYDFSENFQLLKNNIEAALIPLGTMVFQGLNLLIPLLTDGAKWIGTFSSAMGDAFGSSAKVSDLIKQFPDWLQPAAKALLLVADAAGDVARGFSTGGLAGAFDALGPAIKQALGALGSFAIDVVVDIGKWVIGKLPSLADWLDTLFGGGGATGSDSHGMDAADRGTGGLHHVTLSTLAVDILGFAAGKVADLWGWVKGLFGVGSTSVSGDGTGGPDSDRVITLSNVAVGIAGWVISKAVDIGTDIAKFLASTAVTLKDVAVNIASMIPSLAADAWGAAGDFATWLRGEVRKNWNGAVDLGTVTLNALIALGGDLLAWSQDFEGTAKNALNWVGDKTLEVGKLTIYAATEVHNTGGDDTAPSQSFLDKMLGFFENSPSEYAKIDTAVLGGIAYGLGAAVGTVSGLIFDAVGGIIDAIYTAITSPMSVFHLAEAMGKLVLDLFKYAGITVPEAIVTQFWSGIADSFTLTTPDSFTKPIGDTLSGAFGASTDWASGIITAIVSGISTAADAATDWGSALTGKGSDLIAGLEQGWTDKSNELATWAQGFPAWVAGQFSDMSQTLYDQGSQLISGILTMLNNDMTYKVGPWITAFPQWIYDQFTDMSQTLYDQGTQLISGIGSGWTDKSNELAGWAGDFGTWIFGQFPDLSASLTSIGSDLIAGIESGWTTESNNLATWAGNFGGWILGQFPDVSGALYNIGVDLIQGIVDGITGAAGRISSAILGAIPHGSLNIFGVSIPYASGGVVPGFASGGAIPGLASGGRIVKVGEHGWEYAALPVGTRVFSHGDSQGMLNTALRGGGGDTYNVELTVNPAPGMDEEALADMVAARLTRALQLAKAS